MQQQPYFINKHNDVPEILIYGYIGQWENVDSQNFVSEFKTLEASHDRINIRLNTGGGDVMESISIFNCIKNSTAEVHTFVDGLAGSMGSVIALAGHKVFISKYGQMMIHRVSG